MASEFFIPRTTRQFFFDPGIAPALRVKVSDEVVFDCADTCSGQVRSLETLHDYFRRKHPSNPITGPVHVEGARPGGTLAVEILKIDLDEIGFQLIAPNRGVMRDEVETWKHYEIRVRGDEMTIGDRVRLPISPIIGALGNAPAAGATNLANRCGGNLDSPQIRTGAKVYFPIEVEGALFSLGDVHARQGDGELVGAPEIGARVRVRFAHIQERELAPWPVVEDAEHWTIVTTAHDEAEAARLGAIAGARLLAEQRNLPFDDAMVLLGMIAEIHCSRTGNWGQGPVVSLAWPKTIA
jgi:amidase